MTTEAEDGQPCDCARGCTEVRDGQRLPIQIRTGLVCADCEEQVRRALEDIAHLWPRVGQHLRPGSVTVDGDDGRRAVARTHSPSLVRLLVVDLVDHRLGRRWLGTAPSNDRRGALGVLLPIADEVAEVLGHDPRRGFRSVPSEARFIGAHADALARQSWAVESGGAIDEILALRRDVGTAVGEQRLKPVGRCPLVLTGMDGEARPCRGLLLKRVHADSVKCGRCRSTWGPTDLERLGLVLGDRAAS